MDGSLLLLLDAPFPLLHQYQTYLQGFFPGDLLLYFPQSTFARIIFEQCALQSLGLDELKTALLIPYLCEWGALFLLILPLRHLSFELVLEDHPFRLQRLGHAFAISFENRSLILSALLLLSDMIASLEL